MSNKPIAVIDADKFTFSGLLHATATKDNPLDITNSSILTILLFLKLSMMGFPDVVIFENKPEVIDAKYNHFMLFAACARSTNNKYLDSGNTASNILTTLVCRKLCCNFPKE